jgi:hypothetical protein
MTTTERKCDDMNRRTQPGRRSLVIANRTCPCSSLADEVARRAGATPTAVLVVAPAFNSRLRHWVSDADDALTRARERLDLAVAALRQRGVVVRGEIGDANPLLAIHDALASFVADEIIIATLPAGRSNWLEKGLIEKARTRIGLPIAHLISGYDPEEAATQSRPARAAA